MIFTDIIVSIIGGIIGGLITGYVFNSLQERSSSRSREALLRALKNTKKWKYIASHIFIHEDKPEFTIDTNDHTTGGISPIFYGNYNFPDSENNSRVMVHVNIHNKPIITSIFMLLDGGRYFIPMPDSKYSDENGSDESHYLYWDLESPEFDLYKIIGETHNNESIADLAKKFNIITSSANRD